MDLVGRGIITGFIATLVVSGLFHPIAFVARSADALPPTFAWLLHFMIGSLIWGTSFALVSRLIPGPLWMRGVLFGAASWLIVMLAVMPLTRGGWFGLELGLPAPALMLLVHIVYGALLGAIFGLLDPEADAKGAPRGHPPHDASEEHHPDASPLPR
jgi:hypothetical protein